MAALNKLTDTKTKNAPKGKHSDGGGLILRVKSSKQWIFRFTIHSKRSEMGLGSYPSISLAKARTLATQYRKIVSDGISPITQRDKEKLEASQSRPTLEAFAMIYVETGNASEAYRTAYDVSKDTTESSIWVNASKVKNNDKVALRIKELQELAQARHSITVDSLTNELEQARKTAQEAGQASAMVASIMAKAKLHGLLTDKQEITLPNKSMKPTTIVLIAEQIPDYNELN